MTRRQMRLAVRLPRVGAAILLALSFAGVGRLAAPLPAVAIDCNLVLHPLAGNDPSTPGDPHYTTLEDVTAFVSAEFGIFANDGCADGITDMNYVNRVGGTEVVGNGGSITFTPNPDFNGAAGFQYSFFGTYGTSNVATVTITVVPVNDIPKSTNVFACQPTIVAEDSGSSNGCEWVGTAGPNEASQTLTVHIEFDHPELFSTAPHVITEPAGVGTAYHFAFTPAPNRSGTASVSMWLTDNGGTANGGVDTNAKITKTVTITPVDDAPNAGDDAYSTAFNQTLVISAGAGLLHNDTDIDGPGIATSIVSSPVHGSLNLSADGSFTYTPSPGFSGPDGFTYRGTSGALSDTATVKLTVRSSGATAPPPPPAATTPPAATNVPTATATLVPGSTELPTPPVATDPIPGATAAPIATEAAAPTAGTNPGVTTGDSGSDVFPWLVILAIVVVIVIGGNIMFAQYLRAKRPPPAPPAA